MNYILKNKFPGSPKIGTIVTDVPLNDNEYRYQDKYGVMFDPEYIENYPFLWEPIKDHMKVSNGIKRLFDDTYFLVGSSTNCGIIIEISETIEELPYILCQYDDKVYNLSQYVDINDLTLKDNFQYEVLSPSSIRRNSDGKEFTIGDKVRLRGIKEHGIERNITRIKSFERTQIFEQPILFVRCTDDIMFFNVNLEDLSR